MNKTKTQHYVPQFYLNAWSENDKIAVVDKMRDKCYLSGSGNIGAENYFYELRDLEDAPELKKVRKIIQELLEVIETSAGPVIAEINSYSNSETLAIKAVKKRKNKNELARFLAYQFARNPATREVISGFNNATGQAVHSRWLELSGADQAGNEELQFLKELGTDYKKLQHMLLLTHAMPKLVAHFCKYKWQLAFTAPERDSITSDIAVVPLSRRTSKNIIDFFLPLGPQVAFVLSNRLRPIPLIWKCTEAEVESVNSLHLEHSVQQIYHRPQLDGKELLQQVQQEWKTPLEDRYTNDQSDTPKPWWLDKIDK